MDNIARFAMNFARDSVTRLLAFAFCLSSNKPFLISLELQLPPEIDKFVNTVMCTVQYRLIR
jgi:hypothetical protein